MNKQELYSLEDEMSVLGAGLLNEEALFAVADGLTAESFGESRHRKIFTAFKALREAGEPVELMLVARWLKEQGILDQAGGAVYLAELLDNVVTAANVSFYVRKVEEYSQRRKLEQIGKNIIQRVRRVEDLDDLFSETLSDIQTLSEGSSEKQIFYTLVPLADRLEAFTKMAGKNRLATGYSNFDGVIRGGPAPGEVTVLIAQSGVGKSAFMLNWGMNACVSGKYIIIFSIEMQGERIFERMVQIAREHYTYNVESGFHHHSGYREETIKELTEKGVDRLLVCDLPSLSIRQVEHYTRLARSKYGEIGGIFIDYVGLMTADGAKSEYDRITHIADGAKRAAKRLNVPIVILSQINRTSASNGELEKYSAKSSGAVEANADLMLGLQKNDRGELILKLLKQRAGEDDLSFLVEMDWKFLKIRDIKPHNAITAKFSKQGVSRFQKDYQSLQANDND